MSDSKQGLRARGARMIDRIQVVSAAIVDVPNKRLFVQRRSGDTTYPWCWVTPEGKAKPREPHDAALRRELFEEHLVLLTQCPRFNEPVYMHDMVSTRTGEPITVACYFMPSTSIEGQYVAGPKVAGFDWVNAAELEALTLGPADAANRDKLLELLR